jgi:hypothetical protein
MSFIGHLERSPESALIASSRSKEQQEGRPIAAPLAMRSARAAPTKGLWLQQEIGSWRMRLCLFIRALCAALTIVMALPGITTATYLASNSVRPSVPSSVNPELEVGLPEFFKICHDQTYALCAAASCYIFNQVAYCKCDVQNGTVSACRSTSMGKTSVT